MYPHTDTMVEENILAYKATSDPDTMYLHQAMKQPDRKHFLKAMSNEMTDQMDNGNFTIMERSEAPKGKSILPAVWQMKRKRNILNATLDNLQRPLN